MLWSSKSIRTVCALAQLDSLRGITGMGGHSWALASHLHHPPPYNTNLSQYLSGGLTVQCGRLPLSYSLSPASLDTWRVGIVCLKSSRLLGNSAS